MKAKKDDIELLHQYGLHSARRIVRLFREIDEESVSEVCSNLIALDMSDGPITLLLNTPGGEWYNGMAIYDTLRSCKNHVTIIGIGHVMSMGTVLMQAGDERLLSPHCRMMMHYGWDGFEGTSRDMVEAGKEALYLQKQMENIFLRRIREKKPKYTRQSLRALLSVDSHMSPTFFVELGLADKVVGDE